MGEAGVGVDAAVAEEGPAEAGRFDVRQVHRHHQHGLFVDGGAGDDRAVGRGHEALAPEFDAVAARGAAGRRLEAGAVDGHHVTAIGDGVGALGHLPGAVLRRAEGVFFFGMPADGRRVEQDLGAAQGRQAGRLRVPLVPADEHAQRGLLGREGLEAEVAGGEVELLVVARVVGDVHLAVLAHVAAPPVEHGGGVVVEAGGPLLEEAGDDRHVQLGGHVGEGVGGRPRHRLAQRKRLVGLPLAKIARLEKLRQADHPGALRGGLARQGQRVLQVGRRILPAAHLHQADLYDGRHGRSGLGHGNWEREKGGHGASHYVSPIPIFQ